MKAPRINKYPSSQKLFYQQVLEKDLGDCKNSSSYRNLKLPGVSSYWENNTTNLIFLKKMQKPTIKAT